MDETILDDRTRRKITHSNKRRHNTGKSSNLPPHSTNFVGEHYQAIESSLSSHSPSSMSTTASSCRSFGTGKQQKRKRKPKNSTTDDNDNGDSSNDDSGKKQPQCIPVGKIFRIGNETIIGKNNLFKIDMDDYCILSDAPFNFHLAPRKLKPLLAKRWFFYLHVEQTPTPIITRSALRDRVNGGQIMAYQYSECSISGNNCVYYGFVPTIMRPFDDAHKNCKIASMVVWPRKLYVYLRQSYVCVCSPNCTSWTLRLDNYSTQLQSCCEKKINWSRLYVMMGDFDERSSEQTKIIRSCEVCAQCYDCSTKATFCRKHKVCKHKTAKPLDETFQFSTNVSKIKQCRKY